MVFILRLLKLNQNEILFFFKILEFLIELQMPGDASVRLRHLFLRFHITKYIIIVIFLEILHPFLRQVSGCVAGCHVDVPTSIIEGLYGLLNPIIP